MAFANGLLIVMELKRGVSVYTKATSYKSRTRKCYGNVCLEEVLVKYYDDEKTKCKCVSRYDCCTERGEANSLNNLFIDRGK